MEHNPIDRSHDWFRQAERDLTHARTSRAAGHHEWACFAARQAAEKALKGLHLKVGRVGRGHSITDILSGIGDKCHPPESLVSSAGALDGLYRPTRSGGGFETGIPGDVYRREDADRAIEEAHAILEFVRPKIP